MDVNLQEATNKKHQSDQLDPEPDPHPHQFACDKPKRLEYEPI
jgi:hypothetical protein